jgi:MoxR-like ATPase
LDLPYFVLATQNPIEQEGTPLPEAQLDRFMFAIKLEYLLLKKKFKVVKRTTSDVVNRVTPLFTAQEIIDFQIRRIPVADNVIEYAVA